MPSSRPLVAGPLGLVGLMVCPGFTAGQTYSFPALFEGTNALRVTSSRATMMPAMLIPALAASVFQTNASSIDYDAWAPHSWGVERQKLGGTYPADPILWGARAPDLDVLSVANLSSR